MGTLGDATSSLVLIAKLFYNPSSTGVFMVFHMPSCKVLVKVTRTSGYETWSRTSASHGIKLIAKLGLKKSSFQTRFATFKKSFLDPSNCNLE